MNKKKKEVTAEDPQEKLKRNLKMLEDPNYSFKVSEGIVDILMNKFE
jgi:hypothetical protein